MFSGSLDYTICSTDPENYNRIYCNLVSPFTMYSSIVVSSLTCNCDIIIMDENDYIIIEEFNEKDNSWLPILYKMNKEFRAMDRDSALSLIQYLLSSELCELKENVNSFSTIYINEAGRLVLKRAGKYRIKEMSYNCTLISGFYNTEFPIEAKLEEATGLYVISSNSAGFTLSTPILYLVSNFGMQSYRSNKNEIHGSKIVMRINNSFVPNCPIIINNADFETIILSNDLSMLEFRLVDANIHEIKLLSPLYITIHVNAIKDEEIVSELMFSNEVQNELNKNIPQNSEEMNDQK